MAAAALQPTSLTTPTGSPLPHYAENEQADREPEEESPFLPPPPPPPMPPFPENGRARSSNLEEEPKYARVDVRSKRSVDSRNGGTPRRNSRG